MDMINKSSIPFPVVDCRFLNVLPPLNVCLDEEVLFFRAKDCGIEHIFYAGVDDSAWYILGHKAGRWVFAYGDAGEDGQWVCIFDTLSEVGEPYRPWFNKAVVDFATRSPMHLNTRVQ